MNFTSGTINGKDVVIVVCSEGKVNAAMCATTLILNYSPDIVINSGVAGALSSKVSIGDIVIATSAVEHDMNMRIAHPFRFNSKNIFEHRSRLFRFPFEHREKFPRVFLDLFKILRLVPVMKNNVKVVFRKIRVQKPTQFLFRLPFVNFLLRLFSSSEVSCPFCAFGVNPGCEFLLRFNNLPGNNRPFNVRHDKKLLSSSFGCSFAVAGGGNSAETGGTGVPSPCNPRLSGFCPGKARGENQQH